MPAKLLIVSSSDTKFFGLLKDMILSLERLARLPTSRLPPYALGILDLGLSDEDRAWLAERPEAALHEALCELLVSPYGRADWLLAYWTRPLLFSVAARRGWVEPDLQALPF